MRWWLPRLVLGRDKSSEVMRLCMYYYVCKSGWGHFARLYGRDYGMVSRGGVRRPSQLVSVRAYIVYVVLGFPVHVLGSVWYGSDGGGLLVVGKRWIGGCGGGVGCGFWGWEGEGGGMSRVFLVVRMVRKRTEIVL